MDEKVARQAGTAMVVADEAVDQFVETLRGFCRAATVQFALDVGGLVINVFYGGDLAHWRAHGKGRPSLRRLAKRPDLPISAPQLYRCVAIYELSQRLPAISTWKHLGTSHVRTVLGLRPMDQEHLLEFAERERCTVAWLESEVRRIRHGEGKLRGRPPLSLHSKQLLSIERWLDDCPGSLPLLDADALRRTHGVVALSARVADVRRRCEELDDMLRPYLSAMAERHNQKLLQL